MAIFNELRFRVCDEIFFRVFKSPDKGHGFICELDKDHMTELHIVTFDYLVACQSKGLLGSINIIFEMECAGEIQLLSRRVERIESKKKSYVISNTY